MTSLAGAFVGRLEPDLPGAGPSQEGAFRRTPADYTNLALKHTRVVDVLRAAASCGHHTTPTEAVKALVRLHDYCQRKRVVTIFECESTGTVQEPHFSATIKLRLLKITAEGKIKWNAKNA